MTRIGEMPISRTLRKRMDKFDSYCEYINCENLLDSDNCKIGKHQDECEEIAESEAWYAKYEPE